MPCPYDVIVGQDFLRLIGMHFNFEAINLTCFGKKIEMKPPQLYCNPFAAILDTINDDDNSEEEILASNHTCPKQITESNYEKVDVKEAVKAQKHLSSKQKAKLLEVLSK
jgi:hypothetical protein